MSSLDVQYRKIDCGEKSYYIGFWQCAQCKHAYVVKCDNKLYIYIKIHTEQVKDYMKHLDEEFDK